MWANIQQPDRTSRGPQPGAGALWEMPEVWFPGWLQLPLELYASDRQDSAQKDPQLTPQEARRLALEMIAHAIREANYQGESQRRVRDQARLWLTSGEVEIWMRLLGKRINRKDFEAWLNAGGSIHRGNPDNSHEGTHGQRD